jgi:uncharacterized hydrophobic protein (TIGR00341 family)
MPSELRQVEVILRSASAVMAGEVLTESGADAVWTQVLDDEYSSVRAAIPGRSTEGAMDRLATLTGTDARSRVLLTDILVALPRREEPEVEEAEKPVEEPKFGPDRVSREELYADASRGGRITAVYLVLAALSSVVASVGIIRDNTGVVIGAMVIAPLLGPSVALSLGATLGDGALMRRAALAAAAGFGVAIAVSVAVGLIVEIDLNSVELASRTDIGAAEVALALASGIAAALAFTTGASAALIGVMVAVALLPPTVVLGMLIANAEWTLARGAALLVLVNLTAVNLTAVGTFVAQGVRPARWWETAKARRSTRIAVVAWSVLLILLALAIWLER